MCRVYQFYRETMEVSDDTDVKPDAAAAAAADKTSSLDDSTTDDVAAVSDTTDVDIKTEEGLLFMSVYADLRYWLVILVIL